MKKCVICEKQLSQINFLNNNKEYKSCERCRELRKDYYYNKCKDNNFQKERYVKIIDNLNNNDVAARKYLVHRAKLRSKKKNIIFNITYEDILIPKICPILEIPLFFGGNKDNTPSIDRVINNKGYIKGNVKVISNLANKLKGNLTIEQIKKIILYMENNNENMY
jgi:hypothetical protein